MDMLHSLYVSNFWSQRILSLTLFQRYYAQIPDPFLGPKGVRLMLMLRGFFG